jgi:hypothetical protein
MREYMSNREEMPLPEGSVEEPMSQPEMPQMPQMPQAPMPEVEKVPEQESAAPVDRKAVPSGIMVRAKGPGFFENHRKVIGDEFSIPSMNELGNWMECVDPAVRKKHEKIMADKKQKRKTFMENLQSKHRYMAGK